MSLSDYVLIACGVVAVLFTLSYGLYSPWYRDPLGVIVFFYSLAVDALLFLIIYAIVTGARVDESVRLIVTVPLFFALAGKLVMLSVERRKARRRIRNHTPKEPPVDTDTILIHTGRND